MRETDEALGDSASARFYSREILAYLLAYHHDAKAKHNWVRSVGCGLSYVATETKRGRGKKIEFVLIGCWFGMSVPDSAVWRLDVMTQNSVLSTVSRF